MAFYAANLAYDDSRGLSDKVTVLNRYDYGCPRCAEMTRENGQNNP
jgi:hypothetical protein